VGAPDAVSLKARLQQQEEKLQDPTRVRIHRAVSWLKRAEVEDLKKDTDQDARFIFLWIAFNAAYAHEYGFEKVERELLKEFLGKLLLVDRDGTVQKLLFTKFTGSIRTLIENKFVFEPFWRALRDHDSSDDWERRFTRDKKAAHAAVLNGDTVTVLGVIFDRLYVLRNQLIHGAATWNSKVNRQQVKDGADLMGALMPVLISLMLEHPELEWGGISYPVV
jgi:hypothetical protein